MPKKFDSMQFITGDVEAMTEVTVNTKGGSMTATLKKPLREKLGELGGRMTAASVRFATGQAMLLLSPGGGASSAAPVHVHRIGENRFEIELETGADEEIDDVTAAFLELKKNQFIKGELELMPPVNADQWRAEMDEKMGDARRAIGALEGKADSVD